MAVCRTWVNHYNERRNHSALDFISEGRKYSPLKFKESLVNLNAQERPRMIIYAEGNVKMKETSSLFHFCPREEPLNHNCPIWENETKEEY